MTSTKPYIMKTLSVCLIISAGLVFFLLSCNKMENLPTAKQLLSENTIQNIEIYTLIQENLNAEYRLLSLNSSTSESEIIQGIQKEYSTTDAGKLDYTTTIERRERLKQSDLLFSNASVKVNEQQSKISIIDNYIIVKVAVEYSLPTNGKDSETGEQIITEGVDYYDYKIEKHNNSYRIIEKTKVPDFPISNEVSIVEENSILKGESGDMVSGSYSATKAVDFAVKYYKTPPTTDYYDYTSSGGDCTNFLSHCLKKGGWTQVNKWHWNSNGKSCEDNMTTCTRSPSWTGAAKFYEYITNGGSSRVTSKFKDIQVISTSSTAKLIAAFKNSTYVLSKGDVIQLSNSKTKSTVHHSTLVTKLESTTQKVYVTYRNATGYSIAKDKYIGDLPVGQYLQGYKIKATF